MGSLSLIHWIILGVVALLVFGNRLPSVARGMGRSIVEFKKGLKGVADDVTDDNDPPAGRSEERRPLPRDDRYQARDDRGGAASNVRVTRDEASGADPYRDQAR